MIVSYCALARGHPYPLLLMVTFHISNAVMRPSIAYACTQFVSSVFICLCSLQFSVSLYHCKRHPSKMEFSLLLWLFFVLFWVCFLLTFEMPTIDIRPAFQLQHLLWSKRNEMSPCQSDTSTYDAYTSPTSWFWHACFWISCSLCPATLEPYQTQFVKCAQAWNGCVHTNQKDRIFRGSSVKTSLVPSLFLCFCLLCRLVCFSLLWLINCPLCI